VTGHLHHPGLLGLLLTAVILVVTARVLPWDGPVTKWLACLVFVAEMAVGIYLSAGGSL
jgi:hypothetical protein